MTVDLELSMPPLIQPGGRVRLFPFTSRHLSISFLPSLKYKVLLIAPLLLCLVCSFAQDWPRSKNSSQVHVEGMSDGTCDQLYLSLRLASLENWLERHEPIPVIVDDILLNFDDERASAALKALQDLSAKTQVLFFTHHQHLVELAQQCLSPEKLNVIALNR